MSNPCPNCGWNMSWTESARQELCNRCEDERRVAHIAKLNADMTQAVPGTYAGLANSALEISWNRGFTYSKPFGSLMGIE